MILLTRSELRVRFRTDSAMTPGCSGCSPEWLPLSLWIMIRSVLKSMSSIRSGITFHCYWEPKSKLCQRPRQSKQAGAILLLRMNQRRPNRL
jgi:hypothetical protein